MKHSEAVTNHFSDQADAYREKPPHPIWHWLKSDETRSFEKLLKERTFSSALDVGCGQGHYTWLLAKAGISQLEAIDVAPGMGDVTFLPPHTRFKTASIESFHPQEKFDLVSMMGCWEFLESPMDDLSKLHSWLKPMGEIILSCPKDNLMASLYRWRYATKGIRLNRFGLKDIKMWAAAKGMSVSLETGSALCWVLKVRT